MPLDPQLAAMLEFIASADYPPMHEGAPEPARKWFRVRQAGSHAQHTRPPRDAQHLGALV